MQSVTPTGQLFVLRTPPSGASPLAAALDQSGDPGLLGTIAGDDTVLGVCTTPAAARRLAKHLLSLREQLQREGPS
jgi:transcriptional regulator of arginine metabolism